MIGQAFITNLRHGIKSKHEYVRNFPVNACRELKGVFRELGYIDPIDPLDEAAAILSIISAAGGLITVEQDGYRCNSGFIDSFGTTHKSENPVLENLQVMKQYVSDSYFVDEAAFGFMRRRSEEVLFNIERYTYVIQRSHKPYLDEGDQARLTFLERAIEMLSFSHEKNEEVGYVQKVCANCKNDYREDDNYCRYCGKLMGEFEYIAVESVCVYSPAPVKRVHRCTQCHFTWKTFLTTDNECWCPVCGSPAPEMEDS